MVSNIALRKRLATLKRTEKEKREKVELERELRGLKASRFKKAVGRVGSGAKKVGMAVGKNVLSKLFKKRRR